MKSFQTVPIAKGSMSWWYCCFSSCFRSTVCWSHYLVLLPLHKMLLYSYEADIKQISLECTKHNIYIFLAILEGISLILEKPKYVHSFNPLQQTTGNNFSAWIWSWITKMDYYFWKSIDTKKDIAFLKKQQLVWHSPLKVVFLEDNNVLVLPAWLLFT